MLSTLLFFPSPIQSYSRSNSSAKTHLAKEIVPVEIPQKKGNPVVISVDEEPAKFNPNKMGSLKPVFKKDGGSSFQHTLLLPDTRRSDSQLRSHRSYPGVVTAANASSLNDGAAALLLASAEGIKRHNLTPVAMVSGLCMKERAQCKISV